MNGIKLAAYAKINLKLKVLGKLDSGYHDIEMLLASVDIADTVVLKRSDKTAIFMDGVLVGAENTATQAVALCQNAFDIGDVCVEIEKKIPIAAGLGGSSADAAGVFAAVSRVYGIPLEEMFLLAPKVGADVTFMLRGGTAQVKGIGEQVEFVDTLKIHNLVIIKPNSGVTTADAYKKYDEIGYTPRVNTRLVNYLETASIALNPDVANAINLMAKYTEGSLMCGSGSAVYGIFKDEKAAEQVLTQICERDNWNGYGVTAKTSDTGIVFLEEL